MRIWFKEYFTAVLNYLINADLKTVGNCKNFAHLNVYFIPRAIRTVFLPGFAKPTRGDFQARGRQPEGLENPKGRFRKQRAKNVLLPVG